MGVFDVASGTQDRPGSTLPRTPCDLCGEPTVWVENRRTGRRIPLDPTPVEDHRQGEFRRSRKGDAHGKTNVVDPVGEEERWLHRVLYQPHTKTCPARARCRSVGAHSFQQCKDYLDSERQQHGMTQSVRESLQPEAYTRRKDL